VTTGNSIFGDTTSVATATPVCVSFGGTYGTGAVGNAANLKWRLYDDGATAAMYGIGMSAGVMELRAGSSGSIAFCPNNGIEAMRATDTLDKFFTCLIIFRNWIYISWITRWNYFWWRFKRY